MDKFKKSVLVVGVAGGTGLATAALLLDRGYEVIGTVRNAQEEQHSRKEVPLLTSLIQIDLSNGDVAVETLTSQLQILGDRLVGAIVCAATCPYGPLETTPLSVLRTTFEINTITNLAVYQACIARLRTSKGRLIVLSSFGGKLALPFIGHYITSKFALEGLADVMRREASRWGVKVIIVEPGGIKTTMVSDQIRMIGNDIASLSPAVAASYLPQYKEYRGMLETSYAQTNSPAVIAKVAVDALEIPEPLARYAAGDDARQLVELVDSSTDAELDEKVKTMYAEFAKDDLARHGA